MIGLILCIPGCDHPDERPPETASVFLYLENEFHNWYDIEKPVIIKPTHIIFTDINGETIVWSGDYLITTEGIVNEDDPTPILLIEPENSKIRIDLSGTLPDKPVSVKTKNGSTKVQFMRPNLPRGLK